MVSKRTGPGHVLMEVAEFQRGRIPAATTIMRNGKGELVHIMEFADGESLVMNRDLSRPKCRVQIGEVVKEGRSSWISWHHSHEPMDNIVAAKHSEGFRVKVTKRHDAVQLPLVNIQDALAA